MKTPKLSIITPVYNREELIKRAYESLESQTNKDFEWIVVDDGSVDNTYRVVKELISLASFPCKLVSKKNGGKHTALNEASSLLEGEYVMVLDSDDILVDTAVQLIIDNCDQYLKDDVGIVVFMRGSISSGGKEAFCSVKHFYQPVNFMMEKRIVNISTDCCEVTNKDLFIKYKFPEYEGERFIGESALWNHISLNYNCIYIDKVVYLCEYLPGGLTDSGRRLRLRNPLGGMYIAQMEMNKKNSLSHRIKYGILYNCYGRISKQSLFVILHEADSKLIALLTYVPGYILSILWGNKY